MEVLQSIMLNKIILNNTDMKKRTDICDKCPEYNKEKRKCRKCGCKIGLKARFKACKCPIDKW